LLSSTISTLTSRIDSQFLTAYWLPAFVAVLGSAALLVARIGIDQLGTSLAALDSVRQTLALLILLLVTTMVACVLRALTLPIAELFAGATLPRVAADRLTQAQLRARSKAVRRLAPPSEHRDSLSASLQRADVLALYYPREETDVQPTLFGNVLAAAGDHPRLVYGMVGAVWWPRLLPLLPAEFRTSVGVAQAPMMALVNLSVVFALLAVGGGIVMVLGDAVWPAAVVVLVGGLVLSRLCYLAAVSQVAQLAGLIRVAFDLYRHAILVQLGQATPSDLSAERTLWIHLTYQMLDGSVPERPVGADHSGAVDGPHASASRAAAPSGGEGRPR
jgi:hypothetical protein